MKLLTLKYSTSDLLDTTRWVAAFAVVLSHTRNFLLLDWGEVAHPSAGYAAFYFASGFGHIAVLIFFVLSGYLVGGKAFEALRDARFSPRRYLVDRLSRLYPPLLLAIGLTAVCDFVGITFFNTHGFYDNSIPITGVYAPISASLTGTAALANLFFLQTIASPTFGSNSPLWSLANEFWYYLIFPGVAAVISARARAALRYAGALVLAALAIGLLPLEMMVLGIPWLLGAVAYLHAREGRAWQRVLAIAAFLLTICVMRQTAILPGNLMVKDLAVAVAFAIALWLHGRPRQHSSRLPAALAGFSYSLYLIHVPIVFLLSAVTLQVMQMSSKLQPSPATCGLCALFVVVAAAAAFLASRVTEAKTPAIRQWVNGLFESGAKPERIS
jgi:peptidoglycan/LPS O-acetylase OafA/YrhL